MEEKLLAARTLDFEAREWVDERPAVAIGFTRSVTPDGPRAWGT